MCCVGLVWPGGWGGCPSVHGGLVCCVTPTKAFPNLNFSVSLIPPTSNTHTLPTILQRERVRDGKDIRL